MSGSRWRKYCVEVGEKWWWCRCGVWRLFERWQCGIMHGGDGIVLNDECMMLWFCDCAATALTSTYTSTCHCMHIFFDKKILLLPYGSTWSTIEQGEREEANGKEEDLSHNVRWTDYLQCREYSSFVKCVMVSLVCFVGTPHHHSLLIQQPNYLIPERSHLITTKFHGLMQWMMILSHIRMFAHQSGSWQQWYWYVRLWHHTSYFIIIFPAIENRKH